MPPRSPLPRVFWVTGEEPVHLSFRLRPPTAAFGAETATGGPRPYPWFPWRGRLGEPGATGVPQELAAPHVSFLTPRRAWGGPPTAGASGGKPCLNPAPRDPRQSPRDGRRAPRRPRGVRRARGPSNPAWPVSLSCRRPELGAPPGRGLPPPLVLEVPQRLVTSCICPSPSGPGPSRPGGAR